MKTGCYFEVSGPGRIVTSRGVPRRYPAGYRMFKALAPGPWFRSCANPEEYVRRYKAEILAPLDPQKAWDKLHELAGDAEPIMLCYEKAPFHRKNWCHRHLAASWFERELKCDPILEVNGTKPDLVEILGFDPWTDV